MPVTRRGFLATGAAFAADVPAAAADAVPAEIASADLLYERPAPRSEEGIPIGNGRMGSLVWTTPNSLRFQINRADVYASNCAGNSFFERHSDYCGGCAFVDLEFTGFGEGPFPDSGFRQHLSVYEGTLQIEGRGVTAELLAWPNRDVIAIRIADGRVAPEAMQVNLRMLRPGHVQTRNHTADSKLRIAGERIVLTQEFREGSYGCQSAVAIGVTGRETRARLANEGEVRLVAKPGAGAFTVLIASAATFDAKTDIAAEALRPLDAAAGKGFDSLSAETRAWWRDFWSRGSIALHSADGEADFVQQNYHYFLYLMGASSRGTYPPKFNGMLWNTGGDFRTWGTQHWYANLSCYYEALFAANRWELTEPMFAMYSGMAGACAVAARQQWGSQGIYIPETAYFDGLERLPDDIAAEMRDLYLLRKPWEQRSERFREFAVTKHPHSSRWNWIQSGAWVDGHYVIKDRGFGPYGAVNHNFATTAKVAWYFWRRYEYTLDADWLRTRAYPMLKGAVEFYRNHPNVRKGADGEYHIHDANSTESVYGARDTDEDIAAMHGVFGAILRASQILGADADLQPQWREFLDHLAPLPTSDDPEALKPENYNGPRVYVRGLKPALKPGGLLPDGNSLPAWLFEQATGPVADATFDSYFRNGIGPQTNAGVLSKIAIAAAQLGRADAVRHLIPSQMHSRVPERPSAYKSGGVLANRMMLREGAQALDCERLGRASEALHQALLQSGDAIRLFPAWPKEWDARFKLAARGGFLVEASFQKGAVESVEIESLAGAECRIVNPWTGQLQRFPTRKGQRIKIAKA